MAFFTAEQAAHLAGSTARVGWLAEMQFKSEPVRIWSGDTVLDAGGHDDWRPTHGAVQLDGLGFSGEPVSRQITMSLSGVDETLLPLALSESEEADQQPIIFYLQLFDADWQVVGGLIPIALGVMQPPRVSRGQVDGIEGTTQTVQLTVENAMFNRSRPPYGRYTDRDQNRRTTNDRFFEFTPSLVFKSFRWPDF